MAWEIWGYYGYLGYFLAAQMDHVNVFAMEVVRRLVQEPTTDSEQPLLHAAGDTDTLYVAKK